MQSRTLYRSGIGLTLALGLLIGVTGCSKSKDKSTSGSKDPLALTREGWTKFEALDWEGAQQSFEDAINAGASSTDAYSGAGWSYFQLGGSNDIAMARWNTGLTKTGITNDIHFGLGSLALLEDRYGDAITEFSTVLSSSPNYSFIHRPSLDYKDIHLGLAEAYYQTGDFQSALEQVQTLDNTFDTDLTTAEGLASLSQEIDRLSSIVGG